MMRRRFAVWISRAAVGLAFLLLAGSAPARAEAEVPSVRKIGLVDLERVFREYKATQTSEGRLEQLSKGKQSEREKMVTEIRDMRDELLLLNEQSRPQKQQAIEERLRGLALFDRETRDSFRSERDTAVQGILEEIESTVAAYAKEKGFDLILIDRAVLYGVESIDVTGDIVAIMNQNYGKKRS